MDLIVYVVLGVGVLYGLHRLGLWAEERGWIYYRKKHGSSGTLSTAVLEVHSLLEPSKRYVLEETTRDQVEEKDSGDPPTTGDGDAGGAGQQIAGLPRPGTSEASAEE